MIKVTGSFQQCMVDYLDAKAQESIYCNHCEGLANALLIRTQIKPYERSIAGFLAVSFNQNNHEAIVSWLKGKGVDFSEEPGVLVDNYYYALVAELESKRCD